MLGILCTEHVNNEEVTWKIRTARKLPLTIIKRQLKFLGHMMWKEGLENLTLTGPTEDKRSSGKIVCGNR